MKWYSLLFNQFSSLCHTHNLNDSHKNIKWITIIPLNCHCLLSQSHGTLTHLSHVGKVFKTVMAENRLLYSSCCTIGDLPGVVSLAKKIIIQWARSAPYVGFTFSFQLHDCSNSLCLLYAVWGYTAVLKDHTSWQIFMPIPANSLMQSAWCVTANVHIPWYISQIICIENLKSCSHSH